MGENKYTRSELLAYMDAAIPTIAEQVGDDPDGLRLVGAFRLIRELVEHGTFDPIIGGQPQPELPCIFDIGAREVEHDWRNWAERHGYPFP